MKKTILYVITQGAWGGAQRYVHDLATNLNSDFKVFVAVGEPNGKKDLQSRITCLAGRQAYHIPHIKMFQLKHLVRRISPIHDILAIFELKKLYKQLKPDIVHLNSSKAGVLGSLAKKFWILDFGFWICTVYTVHGWVFNELTRKFGRALYRLLEKLTAKWKDKIIVLSDKDLDDGLKIGIDKNKLVKIPLGIAPPQFSEKEAARQSLTKLSPVTNHPSPILIGIIAGLYKTKGLDILIEAIAILKKQKSEINNQQFIIIGDGPEYANLKSKIINHKLEQNVHLLGYIENAEQLLPAFDLFILPSRKEGFPYTILEAIQAQVPVIAAKVGGVSEVIEEKKSGLLFGPGDAKGLADAILYSLQNKNELRQLTARAFENSQKFPLSKMVETTKNLYSSLG